MTDELEISIDTYLDKTESRIVSTVIYDRETRLEPFRKTKSSLLLSDIFIYVDEFFFMGKEEHRRIFKFRYLQALEDGFQFFENFDEKYNRETDYLASGKTNVIFQFSEYSEMLYDSWYREYKKSFVQGMEIIMSPEQKEFFSNEKIFTIDEIFYKNLELLTK
tara:strand:+ start:658 stop:1146 length:489 start_codon:yes stop_codon:yes gene_type:complete